MVTTLFIDFSHPQGQLTPKSVMESCRNSNPSKLLWLTLLPARMKKIHWKMKPLEWSQRFSHYKSMGIFPNAQGQLTHKSFVEYCPISNPSKILWMFSLPARIKKNQSKMKELEMSQGFPHYNPLGAICCHGNQSSDPIWAKTWSSQSPTPMMLLMKFDYDQPADLRDIHVWKCGQTDGRTPTRLPSYNLTLSLRLWWAKRRKEMKQEGPRALARSSESWHIR